MKKEYIERSVKRIKELESVFDEVSKTLKEEPIKLNDTECQNKIKILEREEFSGEKVYRLIKEKKHAS